MSLLLDARKKSQLSHGVDGSRSGFEPGVQEQTGAATAPSPAAQPPRALPSGSPFLHAPLSSDGARIAGQNLFNAKFSPGFARVNRSLLFVLGVAVLLFAAAGGYAWYTGAARSQAVYPVARPTVVAPVVQKTITEAPPNNVAPPGIVSSKPARARQPVRGAGRSAGVPPRQTTDSAPMRIEQHQVESIDPLLNGAYLAYREGKFDRAQQLYRDALKLDERNTDALLGLAAIAQRRGADGTAAHYYAKVLELNPRDAVANAGMSALTTDENRESRLKILLNEQQDSSPLHFALGNYYAAKGRWADAQQAYFNAYRLEPKNAALAFNLAVSLERLGQYKLAAQYYQSALQLDPSHSEGFDHAQISQRIEELTR